MYKWQYLDYEKKILQIFIMDAFRLGSFCVLYKNEIKYETFIWNV